MPSIKKIPASGKPATKKPQAKGTSRASRKPGLTVQGTGSDRTRSKAGKGPKKLLGSVKGIEAAGKKAGSSATKKKRSNAGGSIKLKDTKANSGSQLKAQQEEQLKKVKPSGQTDSNFFEQVYQVARMIPRGRVTSYGAIAASLGARSSSRMVGWAMNSCRSARPKVPAHRVVNRMGILSGKHHFEDPAEMEQMLKKEGVEVKDDQVILFKELFWDPSAELGI